MSSNPSFRNCELVLYPESTTDEQLAKGLSATTKYAFVLHDKDVDEHGNIKKSHWHVMCQFANPKKASTIGNLFSTNPSAVNKIRGTWADALAYLTHRNAPEKHQYDDSEVFANFDWEAAAASAGGALDAIVERIANGEIRAYNYTDFVNPATYVKYKRKFDAAFTYRQDWCRAHLEELVEMKQVIWISGPAGTGKTWMAKKLCSQYKLVYSLASCGKHLFDEYADEPAFVMDDVRPEDIEFTDLLGVLDPYNFKAASARYRNKVLQTELVVVTSALTPEEFACRCDARESGEQLFRRISAAYEMTDATVTEREWDESAHEWRTTDEFPNLIKPAALYKADKSKARAAFKAAMAASQNA